ncbi:MAG: HlyD family type I secretion periplasmic adaptor subunit [Pseudomonadota bacterium]
MKFFKKTPETGVQKPKLPKFPNPASKQSSETSPGRAFFGVGKKSGADEASAAQKSLAVAKTRLQPMIRPGTEVVESPVRNVAMDGAISQEAGGEAGPSLQPASTSSGPSETAPQIPPQAMSLTAPPGAEQQPVGKLRGFMSRFLASLRENSEGLQTNHNRITYIGTLGLVLLFGVGGIWMGTASLAGAVIAPGTVAIQGKPKTIQHPDGGVVSAILVEDGSFVKKDQVVMRLDGRILRADINIFSNRLVEAIAKKDRLVAEREGSDTITWDRAGLEALDVTPSKGVEDGQLKLFDARKRTRDGQIDQLKKRVEQNRNQLVRFEFQRQAADDQITLLKEELDGLETLRQKGLASKRQLRTIQRQIAELQGDAGEAEAEKARVENSINETEVQILQVEWEFSQNVLQELGQTELEIRDLSQQLLAAKTQLERTQIRAPDDGVVNELAIHTVGGVISPGDAIMRVVPQSEVLEIEIKIEPQFVDNVRVGQEAAVRFSGLNQRDSKDINGEVKFVAPNSVVSPENGTSYYTAMVSIRENEFDKIGNTRLVPGMPAEVFVKTDERTPLNYLLKPLTDQLVKAFREE